MFRWLNSRKGQNTAEYAILIGVIVAAAIAMQVYMRRGMQSRVRDAVDYVKTADTEGQSGVAGVTVFTDSNLMQYEPYYTNTDFDTTQLGETQENLQTGGGVVRSVVQDETTRNGIQAYTNYEAGNL